MVVDAVGLYATAMNDLGNIESIQSEQLNCRGGAPWSGGETFLRYLKGVCYVVFQIGLLLFKLYFQKIQVEYTGLTGEILFDMNGQRTDFKLDLIEKQRDNMVKTGIWYPDTGVNYTMTVEEGDAIVVKQLQNMTLRVVTVLVGYFYISPVLHVD